MRTYLTDDMPRVYYMCGPSGMMSSVENALKDNGISADSIVKEHFVNPGQEEGKTEEAPVEETGDFSGIAKVKVHLDYDENEIELSSDGDVILDAVLDAGLDPPFSCKGGVCTTCKAKLVSGKVSMDNNYALTDSEVEEGYILTCQSHPKSPEVEISYDEV